jgi:LuxR family maltose regulon positive regulatory protein
MDDSSVVRITLPRLRADLVRRPQLQSRLGEALAHSKLVLLSAPAGYGKTVALVQALCQAPADHAVAWVSASEDDDLQRVLRCLLEALDPFDLPWQVSPEALPAVVVREGGLRWAVDELVRHLACAEVARGVMAIDDVHRIADPRVFDFLARLVTALPQKWTMAMTSRKDPPLPLARMKITGELAEFRQEDLRFQREDVQMLFQAAHLPTTDERVEQFLERTQGWVVGLNLELLAQTARRHGARAHTRTFDYLAQEVFEQLPPPMQAFLLRCSVLPELNAKRCEYVSGDARAAHWLGELERQELFVTVLGDRPVTLRLHDLFREFLEGRLVRERFQETPQLLKRAAQAEPDVVRRVGYLLGAGAAQDAALEMLNATGPMIHSGTGEQLMRLIERFPEPLRTSAPELAFVRGLFAGQRAEFVTMLESMQSALAGFERRQQWSQALQARGLACMALIYLGRMDQGLDLWKRAASIEQDPAAQVVDAFIAFWRSLTFGSQETTPQELWRIVRLIPAIDADHWVLHFHNYFLAVGRPGTRAPLWALVEALFGRAGESRPQLRLAALRLQAWLVMWEGNVDAARQLCGEVSAEAQWLGNPPMAVNFNRILIAFERQMSGDYARAKQLVEETFEAARRNPQRRTGPIFLNLLAGLATAAQDWSTAQQLLSIANEASKNQPEWPLLKLGTVALIRAELLLHDGRHAQAALQLRPLLDEASDRGILTMNPRFRVALARAELGAGDVEAAWKALAPALQHAMDAGEPAGLLLCGPTALQELVEGPWLASIDPAQLACLRKCAARALELRSGNARSADAPSESPLSDRELQLLELVAQGKSNEIIARTLSINPQTVKRQMARIFDKTGQSSRGRVATWHRSRTLQ